MSISNWLPTQWRREACNDRQHTDRNIINSQCTGPGQTLTPKEEHEKATLNPNEQKGSRSISRTREECSSLIFLSLLLSPSPYAALASLPLTTYPTCWFYKPGEALLWHRSGHFEDVNFSKQGAKNAVAAGYPRFCVHVHVCMFLPPFFNGSNSSIELETDHYFLLSSSHNISIPAQTRLPMSTLFAFLSEQDAFSPTLSHI